MCGMRFAECVVCLQTHVQLWAVSHAWLYPGWPLYPAPLSMGLDKLPQFLNAAGQF